MNLADLVLGKTKVKSKIVNGIGTVISVDGAYITIELEQGQIVETRKDLFVKEYQYADAT